MDLIDEQQLARLQIHQQAHDVARTLQGWCAGDATAHTQLFGQHQSHGGFAQAWRAIKQHVIERFLAGAGGFHRNAQHLLELPLADVIGQPPRPQGVFPLDRSLWCVGRSHGCVLLASRGRGIHQAPGLPRPASGGGA